MSDRNPASDPCLACGTEVAHRDSLYITQFPGTGRNKVFVFCGWDHLKLWQSGVTPEVMEQFKAAIAETEQREPVPDDFREIDRYLAELRMEAKDR